VTRLLARETLRHPWTSEASATHKLWSLPTVSFLFAAASLIGMVARLELDRGALVATFVCACVGLVGSAALGVLHRRGWFEEIDRP
jgi:hypothetical protein